MPTLTAILDVLRYYAEPGPFTDLAAHASRVRELPEALPDLCRVVQGLREAWRLCVRVAHLDHALRPGSAQDAEYVRTLGLRWKIPATVAREDVAGLCVREGWSLEDGARRVRYRFLAAVARAHSADCVALAHTADDQAETVLMRLIRGTGLLGLGAMAIQRVDEEEISFVRPLLDVWRPDVMAYLHRQGLVCREDPSNANRRFLRNRIRHELLPLLEQGYNPNIKRTLLQLAEQSRWDYGYLQQAAARQWARLAKAPSPRHIVIRIETFRRQPKALQRQLVRHAIRQVRGSLLGLEFRHWLEVERMFLDRPVGTLVDLPGGVQFRRESAHVVCQALG
jgi:tRNA(Ile)-lysidine synthase